MHPDQQALTDAIRRLRAFYEIYPDLTLQPAGEPATWFEIALYVEVEEYRPTDHPKSREAVFVLMELAERLIWCAGSRAPYGLEMPQSYYTLHPSEDRTQQRMALTLSLVFSDAGRYTSSQEPALLTQLRAELALLGVSQRTSRLDGSEHH